MMQEIDGVTLSPLTICPLNDNPTDRASLFPATDEEIAAALESFGGFPTTDFQRIRSNVIVADGSIVVVLKLWPDRISTLYVVDEDGLSEPYGYDHLKSKAWATDEVIDAIREAQTNLNPQKR